MLKKPTGSLATRNGKYGVRLNLEQKQMFEFIQTYLQQFEDVLSVKEVALLLGYSQSSVVKWCRTKRLTAFDVGGHIIIPKLALIDFLFGPHFDGIHPSGTVATAFFKAKKAHQL